MSHEEEEQHVAEKKELENDEDYVTSTEDNVQLTGPEKRKHLKRKKKKRSMVKGSLRKLCNPDPVTGSLEALGPHSHSAPLFLTGLGPERETRSNIFLYKELRRHINLISTPVHIYV